MLSYQHLYHAGNLADVHKHALLAVMLDYLAAKDKPLSYIETHAGRGLYSLDAPEAQKTAEAAAGILRVEHLGWFDPAHPYARALAAARAKAGPMAYPGSPRIARTLLRPGDSMHLAELHPQEHSALKQEFDLERVDIQNEDGFAMARRLCPPMPRRGLLFLDPSYEIKDDFTDLPPFLAQIAQIWNVGILVLWYPLLSGAPHRPMTAALRQTHPQALLHEVQFPAPSKGLLGSGMFVSKPTFGLQPEAGRLSKLFAALGR